MEDARSEPEADQTEKVSGEESSRASEWKLGSLGPVSSRLAPAVRRLIFCYCCLVSNIDLTEIKNQVEL